MMKVLKAVKVILNTLSKMFLVIAVIVVIVCLFFALTKKDKTLISPQGTIEKQRTEIYKIINDPQYKNNLQGKISVGLYRGVVCHTMGEACTDNPSDGDKNFPKSLLGFVTGLIAYPYLNPPASGVYYVYDGLNNAGFIPKTYAAQGIGLASIRPLMKIWVACRNLAYLIIVLVIVVVGFMIMFRVKINPQTVISLENALPKIVLTLIFITFSFAIAGFLIDLMYVLIALIISILGEAGNFDIPNLQKQYIQASPSMLFSPFFKNKVFGPGAILWTLPNALLNLVPLIGGTVRVLGSILGFYALFPFLYNTFGVSLSKFISALLPVDIVITPLGAGATVKLTEFLHMFTAGPIPILMLLIAIFAGSVALIPLIVGIIILLTMVFIFFRLFLMFLSGYIHILWTIAIAPIYLILNIFPGQSTFSGWFKGLIAELLMFPAAIAIFLFSTIVVNETSAGNFVQLPFLVGFDPKNFGMILGMSFLFITPDLIKALKQVLVPKPGPVSVGLGSFFGGVGGLGAGVGAISQFATMSYYIKPLGNIIRKMPGGEGFLGKKQE